MKCKKCKKINNNEICNECKKIDNIISGKKEAKIVINNPYVESLENEIDFPIFVLSYTFEIGSVLLKEWENLFDKELRN
jgi:hypothetical protein